MVIYWTSIENRRILNMANYNVVETTNMYGSKCFSFQATTDIENGFLITKGDLISGEKEIYVAKVPTDTDEVYLVTNPAWSYDDYKATDQNEENFINKAGISFRGRQLKKDNKFTVYNTGIASDVTIAKDQYITVDGTTHKPKAVDVAPATGFLGKIVLIEEIGFPYCIGSIGQPVINGSDSMGYAADTRVTKVTIEVIRNA